MCFSPAIHLVVLSTPIPKPVWGGIPYFLNSRYQERDSAEKSWLRTLSINSSYSAILCPHVASSPTPSGAMRSADLVTFGRSRYVMGEKDLAIKGSSVMKE